jgi:HD-GYP domain-containing protein (c-di-GMP phosphodiesterase class II)/HD-like signal output (HDOD) protein
VHAVDIITEVKDRLAIIYEEVSEGRRETLKDSIVFFARLLQFAFNQNHDGSLATIFLKSPHSYSVHHSVDAAIGCACIGYELGWDSYRVERLMCAALTMNVSCSRLQDAMYAYNKPVDDRARAIIAQHPQQSGNILKEAGVTDVVWLDTVLHHHERLDGSGYPDCLKGAALSIEVRILGLVDMYNAMESPRAYRVGQAASDIAQSLLVRHNAVFDRELVSSFLRIFGLYPPGTLIELNQGSVVLVKSPGKKFTTPLVCDIDDNKVPMSRNYELYERYIGQVLSVNADSWREYDINLQELWPDLPIIPFNNVDQQPSWTDQAYAQLLLGSFPDRPAIVTELLLKLSHKEPDPRDIAMHLMQSQSLMKSLMKIANLSMFNLGNQLDSVNYAIGAVGAERFGQLILAANLQLAFQEIGADIDDRFFCDEFIMVAYICERIADLVEGVNCHEAFIGGLFLNSGAVFLSHKFSDYVSGVYENSLCCPVSMMQKEVADYGVEHGTLGYILATKWQLSKMTCDAIYQHNNPDWLNVMPVGQARTMTAVFGMAHNLVNRVLSQGELTDEGVAFYQAHVQELCITADELGTVERELSELF